MKSVMEKCISVGSCEKVKVKVKVEVEGKVHPRTGHEGPEGCRGNACSTTLSLTSALDGVGGQRHAQPALLPGKTRCPLYRRLGGPQGRSGWVRKISIPGPASPQGSPCRLSYPGPQGSLCGVKMNYFTVEMSDRTHKRNMVPQYLKCGCDSEKRPNVLLFVFRYRTAVSSLFCIMFIFCR